MIRTKHGVAHPKGTCLTILETGHDANGEYWFDICGKPAGYVMVKDDDGNPRRVYATHCSECDSKYQTEEED